jgi:hypothetical protein
MGGRRRVRRAILPGSTDVGTGIVYALLFITLLAFAPPARRERLSLDRVLVPRWPAR